MTFAHIFLLAAIQGLTEFIPVSSSGHLNLVHAMTDLPDLGVGLDVALHAGTLLAVMVYFRRDTGHLIGGGVDILRRRKSPAAQQAWMILLATVPVLLAAAALMAGGWLTLLRSAQVIAWASIIFAVPLYLADRYGASDKSLETLAARPALLIGLAQVLALIPGASRSGVTIMAARGLGFDRSQAARFSMLLSMPVIFCFAIIGLADLLANGDPTALGHAALAAALAAVFAFIAIDIFMRMMQRMTLAPFVIYRIALGIGLLLLIS
jgi:undecaprenyl-diphosphatase